MFHPKIRRAIFLATFAFATTASPIRARAEYLSYLEAPPATLNPRATLDATGQRLDMLLFRGLTQLDANLEAQGDLAESWKPLESGKTWEFRFRAGQKDLAGAPISTDDYVRCVRQYLDAKPTSPLKSSFPSFVSVAAKGDAVVFRLGAADPYFPKNASLLRFFRVEGAAEPCQDPTLLPGAKIVGTGPLEMRPFRLNPEKEVTLYWPGDRDAFLRFNIVRDETTRSLKILRGEGSLLQNALSKSKIEWLLEKKPGEYRWLNREGVSVSYLAYNLRDPILSDARVRRAIALAIDREQIVRYRHKGFLSLAGSLLSPLLPESENIPFPFDPAEAGRLLDEAGHPRGKDGYRFALRYKTTPARDGYEMAYIFQEMLKKVGIELRIEMVDFATYFASLRKGAFQLYSSRWVGVSDGAIFERTLQSGNPDNRVGYANPEVDALIREAMSEIDPKKRAESWKGIQRVMARDLPYFPLWFWSNALVLRKDIVGLEAKDLSLSGSYVPLLKLRKR